jgi:hypothetical protein
VVSILQFYQHNGNRTMVNYGKYSINGGDDLSGLYDRTTNNHDAKQQSKTSGQQFPMLTLGIPQETYVLIIFISKRLAVLELVCWLF